MKHRIFCILFILILAAGALFTAACVEPSQGSEDPSDKTPASDETTTVTESPTEATAEPSTEPSTEPTTESSTVEGESGTPEIPLIQISYASRQLNAADKTNFLKSYLRLLAFTEDVSGLDYLSDEIKANWDYLPYATADFTVSVVWEVNGRCEPHRVYVYPAGKSPESGLCIKIDRFGAAKVLSFGEEDE